MKLVIIATIALIVLVVLIHLQPARWRLKLARWLVRTTDIQRSEVNAFLAADTYHGLLYNASTGVVWRKNEAIKDGENFLDPSSREVLIELKSGVARNASRY